MLYSNIIEQNIKLSIVIVSYNSSKYLMECVLSIDRNLKKIKYEIIVIDNASSDDTHDIAWGSFKNITIIRNNLNRGFGFANNQGFLLSKGEYVLFLNPDIIVLDDAIELMVNFLENNVGAGACGCRLLNQDLSLQPSYFEFPNIYKEIGHLINLDFVFSILKYRIKNYNYFKYLRKKLILLDNIKDITEVDYVLGACLMVRKTVLDKTGAFDENIFMYIEDTELCYRIKLYGYKIYYIPEGKIIHFGGKSAETNDGNMLYQYNKSRLYFYKKYYGWRKINLLKIVIMADMIFKMIAVWFKVPRGDMKKAITRYANQHGGRLENSKVYIWSKRYSSFKIYMNIFKMTIEY